MVAGLAAACSSTSVPASAGGHAPIPAPKGLPAFYAVPQPLPTGPAGTLVKAPVKVAVAGLHGTVYRVMYMSESVMNKPVVVTGLIIVPDTPAPTGYFRCRTPHGCRQREHRRGQGGVLSESVAQWLGRI